MTNIINNEIKSFICPLTHKLMEDPLMCSEGHSFSYIGISKWFYSGKKTCPLNNNDLLKRPLLTNFALRDAIEEWKKIDQPKLVKFHNNNTYCQFLCRLNNIHIENNVPQPNSIFLLHTKEIQKILANHSPQTLTVDTFAKYSLNDLFSYKAAKSLNLDKLANDFLNRWNIECALKGTFDEAIMIDSTAKQANPKKRDFSNLIKNKNKRFKKALT
ncbi:MAG: hypothetical protein JHC93_05020 [Parachlamydiales bacterium]|nr:hypothetical protein [Parachlamydiales bacterium]